MARLLFLALALTQPADAARVVQRIQTQAAEVASDLKALAADAQAELATVNSTGCKTGLDEVLDLFRASAKPNEDADELTGMLREQFHNGLNKLAEALSALGGDLGKYIRQNTDKCWWSPAVKCEDWFCFLQHEWDFQRANSWGGYVDASCWMGNLWIGWELEFFAEVFERLGESDGDDSISGIVQDCCGSTLCNHFSWIQKGGFYSASGNMPRLRSVLANLQGDCSADNDFQMVKIKLKAVAQIGKKLAAISIKINAILDAELSAGQCNENPGLTLPENWYGCCANQ